MIVYLIRHGEAVEQSLSGADADRALTLKGSEQAQALAAYLKRESAVQENPTRIEVIASPYVRTRQTAAPIWEILEQAEKVDDRLAAVSSVSEIIEVISEAQDHDIAVVSHNPIISRAVDVLIDGPEAQRMFLMAPGQLIALRVDPERLIGTGELFDRYRVGDC
ncbi:MAG: histidine phosphatase family protein [Phycisphaerales bacterium]|nr:histidine phosphatase family protein [Phycisphaerales bacterium]